MGRCHILRPGILQFSISLSESGTKLTSGQKETACFASLSSSSAHIPVPTIGSEHWDSSTSRLDWEGQSLVDGLVRGLWECSWHSPSVAWM